VKTNKERLDEWYAKLHGLWMSEWLPLPDKEFEELLARPRKNKYAYQKRQAERQRCTLRQ
jgi:hypothetical protein